MILKLHTGYRQTRADKDKNRPIMVTLSKPYVRTELLKDKKELNKHAICKAVWVNEDLNATVKVCKNEARNVARLANKHGRVARQSGSGVVIDGIYYTHSALDHLLKEINIAATRTRYTNNHVGSTGHRDPCQTCTLPLSLLKAMTLLKHTRWHNRYGILVIHISPRS